MCRDVGNVAAAHHGGRPRQIFYLLTVVELFCHRRRVDIQSDISPWPSCLHLSSGFPSHCTISVHHLPSGFVAFLSVVVLLAGSRVHFLWVAVGAILLMCDRHLILFLLAVCSAGCMFTRRLISSFLILSILVFPAAFLRHLISVVVNICLSLLVRVQFSLW